MSVRLVGDNRHLNKGGRAQLATAPARPNGGVPLNSAERRRLETVISNPRFWSKVKPADFLDCWEWMGRRDRNGYGDFATHGRTFKAHRVSWATVNGPIGEGLHVDHLCRNPSCVNPAHLEPVTPRVNILRGEAFSAVHARKTHCPRGHEYNLENTYFRKDRRGRRQCRVCSQEAKELQRRERAHEYPTPLALDEDGLAWVVYRQSERLHRIADVDDLDELARGGWTSGRAVCGRANLVRLPWGRRIDFGRCRICEKRIDFLRSIGLCA